MIKNEGTVFMLGRLATSRRSYSDFAWSAFYCRARMGRSLLQWRDRRALASKPLSRPVPPPFDAPTLPPGLERHRGPRM